MGNHCPWSSEHYVAKFLVIHEETADSRCQFCSLNPDEQHVEPPRRSHERLLSAAQRQPVPPGLCSDSRGTEVFHNEGQVSSRIIMAISDDKLGLIRCVCMQYIIFIINTGVALAVLYPVITIESAYFTLSLFITDFTASIMNL